MSDAVGTVPQDFHSSIRNALFTQVLSEFHLPSLATMEENKALLMAHAASKELSPALAIRLSRLYEDCFFEALLTNPALPLLELEEPRLVEAIEVRRKRMSSEALKACSSAAR